MLLYLSNTLPTLTLHFIPPSSFFFFFFNNTPPPEFSPFPPPAPFPTPRHGHGLRRVPVRRCERHRCRSHGPLGQIARRKPDRHIRRRLTRESRREGCRPASLRRREAGRSEEHTSELQSLRHRVCRLLLV